MSVTSRIHVNTVPAGSRLLKRYIFSISSECLLLEQAANVLLNFRMMLVFFVVAFLLILHLVSDIGFRFGANIYRV